MRDLRPANAVKTAKYKEMPGTKQTAPFGGETTTWENDKGCQQIPRFAENRAKTGLVVKRYALLRDPDGSLMGFESGFGDL